MAVKAAADLLSTGAGYRNRWSFMVIVVLTAMLFPLYSQAQQTDTSPVIEEMEADTDNRVEVQPISSDDAIKARLTNIMVSTGWFDNIQVEVNDGVVFLDGGTLSDKYRSWAGDLANRTRDVVAVVNRIQVKTGPAWNLAPAIDVIRNVMQQTVRALPMIGLALIIFVISIGAARAVAVVMRKLLSERLNPLILSMAARTLALLTFLLGLYLVLHVAGLTRLAATVIGGTGIAGLVAGIAFRDILENYLASILISLRNPFRLGDVVDIGGHLGVVQRVTSRGTVLMDLNGNHIQIPNATVYKSIIQNYTANPNRRDFFEVGIGYENDIAEAQEIAFDVLVTHPAVLTEPEPLVLTNHLGAATVNLKVYYWYNGATHNGLTIRSSLLRLVKEAFQNRGISMPDEAREIVFPEDVPVRLKTEDAVDRREYQQPGNARSKTKAENKLMFTEAEGHQFSEAAPIQRQAQQARNPEESPDLLSEPEENPTPEKP
ncbi:MAG: mechanosensitive ion channel [Desulfobacteraceae bacterium]|nr:mechanosensitive ion channel [Desulfobacteraceae bacterium]MBC2751502.1 mechanosensitive ion channel [Desulfobacteraceae bacterium]